MNESMNDSSLTGLELRHTFVGHKDSISGIAWSPDGQILASASKDRNIGLWNRETEELCTFLKGTGRSGAVSSVAWLPDRRKLISGSTAKTVRLWDVKTEKMDSRPGHSDSINSVAVSPDGQMFASGSSDRTIRVWSAKNAKLLQTFKGHTGEVLSVAWSPDGRLLASGSRDKTIKIWDINTGKILQTFGGHTGEVLSVAWSPDGQILASGSRDCTIRIWDLQEKRRNILEAHTGGVTCVSFSFDGRLLASKSNDGAVGLWRCDMWELVRDIDEPTPHGLDTGHLAFHPKEPILATLGEKDTVIRIWDLDIDAFLSTSSEANPVYYTNAKIVLVGDTGVGKSGLGLVLSGKPFEKTESTHGRYVRKFDSLEVELENGRTETREMLLWDLAGQPSYRLIHQLHLNEVAVALVIFDARSETDPFAGVHYWNRAINEAQRVQNNSALPLKKFLVSSRADRGGIDASRERIQALVNDLGFDGYFDTSAKDGLHISELADAIRSAVKWDAMPKVSSTELFQNIKDFLITEKLAGCLLSTVDDLYRAFLRSTEASRKAEDLRAEFETCIGRVESQGLIRRLSFGNFILLQPELLDAYASALVNAAKDEPDGLGCIFEEKARKGDFRMSEDERLPNKEQEKLLLIATIEDLLNHEIALLEQAEDGPYLVFPSQFTRELPNASDPDGKAVIFEFEGAIQNIYSRLAVRLSHSGLFTKQAMWKNAAVFNAFVGGSCGVLLRQIEEGRAELTLFFDTLASEETRFQFEEYVYLHLQRQQLPLESIHRRRIFVCPGCDTPLTEQQVKKRQERGFDWINCNVCDEKVSLLDREKRLAVASSSASSGIEYTADAQDENNAITSAVSEMERTADAQRTRDTAASILQGKIATKDFDIFLCHNSEDKPKVKEIGEKLKQLGILPWLDEWELRPGFPWQEVLEEQIETIKAVAVFVGEKGIGPWQNVELNAFLREFVERRCPVIPVLLPNALKQPKLPISLKGMMWVDFRQEEPNPINQLLWGITGERSSAR